MEAGPGTPLADATPIEKLRHFKKQLDENKNVPIEKVVEVLIEHVIVLQDDLYKWNAIPRPEILEKENDR